MMVLITFPPQKWFNKCGYHNYVFSGIDFKPNFTFFKCTYFLYGVSLFPFRFAEKHNSDSNNGMQWSLTYPDTSVPRLTVRITEFPDK